jgi:thymidine phosphorylase
LAQGGNIEWIENTDLFPKAKYQVKVIAENSGYIKSMNTEKIGKISGYLGSGREKKDDLIDYSAGISILKKTSEYVNKDDCLAVLYTNKEEKIEEAKKDYISALELTTERIEEPKLIYEICE